MILNLPHCLSAMWLTSPSSSTLLRNTSRSSHPKRPACLTAAASKGETIISNSIDMTRTFPLWGAKYHISCEALGNTSIISSKHFRIEYFRYPKSSVLFRLYPQHISWIKNSSSQNVFRVLIKFPPFPLPLSISFQMFLSYTKHVKCHHSGEISGKICRKVRILSGKRLILEVLDSRTPPLF